MAKEKKAPAKETTVSGFVEETEQEDGEPGVQLVEDDSQYQVVMDNQGSKLLDYVDEELEVTGIVTKNKGVRELKVIQFRVLDEFEDDDDDDLYDDDEFFSDRRDD